MTTEKEMRPIVETWLQGKGFYVAHEVRLCGYCDLIGCKWSKRNGRRIPTMLWIVSVELKISDISGVLYQAKNNSRFADYSYGAMPLQKCESMRDSTLQKFKEKRVGLLGVSDCVKVIVSAWDNNIVHNKNICRNLWNFKVRHSPRGA